MPQVQLQRVQDHLFILLQNAPHVLKVLSNLLLHDLCGPLQEGAWLRGHVIRDLLYIIALFAVLGLGGQKCIRSFFSAGSFRFLLTERSALRFFRDWMRASVLDVSACSSWIRLVNCSCRQHDTFCIINDLNDLSLAPDDSMIYLSHHTC